MHSSDRHLRLSKPAAGACQGRVGSASLAISRGENAPLPAANVATLDSHSLLQGRTRIAIRHRDEIYWLHETRQGKLLLTK